ncbi:hypothetical protein bcgnr5369_16380 [Bacillus cereus]
MLCWREDKLKNDSLTKDGLFILTYLAISPLLGRASVGMGHSAYKITKNHKEQIVLCGFHFIVFSFRIIR